MPRRPGLHQFHGTWWWTPESDEARILAEDLLEYEARCRETRTTGTAFQVGAKTNS